MRILVLAFWVIEMLALAIYIRSCWPERTRTSFHIKVLCATIFLAYGIVLAGIASWGVNLSFVSGVDTNELSAGANTFEQFANGTGTDRVAHLIIAALAYGWIGDFCLGLAHQIKGGANTAEEKDVDLKSQAKNRKTTVNALGVLAFILGHCLYCVAFGRGIAGYEFGLHWWSAILFALPLIAYGVIGVKLKLGKHLVPLGVYFAAVAAMFGLAMTLGIQLWSLSKAFSLCLMIGATFFALSDLGLSLESYGGERFQSFPLRVCRQIAYFSGQMFLATTILFFYTV